MSDPLLHDLFIVDSIPDINVRRVWHMRDSRIQVEDIRRRVFGMQVRVEALHQSGLSLYYQSKSKQE